MFQDLTSIQFVENYNFLGLLSYTMGLYVSFVLLYLDPEWGQISPEILLYFWPVVFEEITKRKYSL